MEDSVDCDPFEAPPSHALFVLFPKLPLELRLSVWRHTFEARKISCRVQSDGSIRPSIFVNCPATLIVCIESREEALKWYTLLFRQARTPTWFNLSIDIPHLKHELGFSEMNTESLTDSIDSFEANFLESFNDNFTSKLRHLAFDRDLWLVRIGHISTFIALLKRLQVLLLIVIGEGIHPDNGRVDRALQARVGRGILMSKHPFNRSALGRRAYTKYFKEREALRYGMFQCHINTWVWDHGQFTETRCNTKYATYVKEDMIRQLAEGETSGGVNHNITVKVVIEVKD